MVDKIIFHGEKRGEAPGEARAQVELRSDGLWVYVEVVNGTVQIWSGLPCQHCKQVRSRYIRCRLHSGVMMIARQLDLV